MFPDKELAVTHTRTVSGVERMEDPAGPLARYRSNNDISRDQRLIISMRSGEPGSSFIKAGVSDLWPSVTESRSNVIPQQLLPGLPVGKLLP